MWMAQSAPSRTPIKTRRNEPRFTAWVRLFPHQAKSGTEIRLVHEYRRLKRMATDDSSTGFTSDYAQVKDGQYIDMWGVR
jgi:hypothetical protein